MTMFTQPFGHGPLHATGDEEVFQDLHDILNRLFDKIICGSKHSIEILVVTG